jgi:peptide deformylase
MSKNNVKKFYREHQKKVKEYRRQKHISELKHSIRQFNDPVLFETSEEVVKEENLDFIKNMKKILAVSKSGVGLAAPQIGVLKKVIVIDPKKENNFQVMINPRIVEISQEMNIGLEGCLSYPNIYIPVERANKIKVEYTTEEFEKNEKEFDGFDARVVWHEIDHISNPPVCFVGEIWKESNDTGQPIKNIIQKRMEQRKKELELAVKEFDKNSNALTKENSNA